jgi:hypothetical protein
MKQHEINNEKMKNRVTKCQSCSYENSKGSLWCKRCDKTLDTVDSMKSCKRCNQEMSDVDINDDGLCANCVDYFSKEVVQCKTCGKSIKRLYTLPGPTCGSCARNAEQLATNKNNKESHGGKEMTEHIKEEKSNSRKGGLPAILWFILVLGGFAFAYYAYTGWLRTACIDRATVSGVSGGTWLDEDLYKQCMGTFQ